MAGRLEDKIAIITGGSRGIGAATALMFAREGAKVVIASRKQEGLDRAAEAINAEVPGSVFPRACHIGEAEAIEELVAWCEEEVGRCNVLVNNAATNPYFGPLLDTPQGAWDKTFEVNLQGYFRTTRAVCRRLLEAEAPGAVINVASIAGMLAMPLQGVYGMTKAAVIAMTRSLALELGAANIRVNAIAPGLVETKLAAAITSTPEVSAFFTDRAPAHRVAEPEEIAGLITFLASDEASFVTGQCYPIDGGFTVT